ncbi:murein hydrolase activator EnvC family protein [Caminibacter pacificus]
MRWIVIFLAVLVFGASVTTTKKEIKKTQIIISKMNDKLDKLAREIRKKQQSINSLNSKINSLNKEIAKLQETLKDANKVLGELNDLKKGYVEKENRIKNEIIDFLSTNYYLDTQEVDNVNDLIYNEISKKILEANAQKIAKIVKQSKTINQNISSINEKIDQIIKKQQELKSKKEKLLSLLKARKKEIQALNRQKLLYKKRLEALIRKQKNLQNRLAQLKIIKKRKQTSVQQPNYNVKTAVYKGQKTIPPLRGRVIKKFGSYIDPVYKIRIYNDSITIKPYQKNAIVRAIMPGKVVYIGENNDKKIIVIKHKGDIFSIYANLDKISPLIKKGKYVKRGQIIARVTDTLEFEVTYKEKPINPLKVISLR